jgi:tyrosinase
MVTILTPTGNVTLPNPLYSYTFQSDATTHGFDSGVPLYNFPSTVRYYSPNTPGGDQNAASAKLQRNAASVNSLLYQMFSSVTDYNGFSCTSPNGQSNPANNIENLHNGIHNDVGGQGHMSYPQVAAFDPIFWLHHANVDRQFAMWQALNPNSWMGSTVDFVGSYYRNPGSTDSGSSALAPFHLDNGNTLFTNDDVRSTARFGYTYPELPDWSMDAGSLRSHVIQQINQLYNPSLISTQKRSISRPLRRAGNLATAFSTLSLDDAKQLGVNNARQQWSAKISMDRYAHNTSFTLYFFIGNPPADVSAWPTALNLVGSLGRFVSEGAAVASLSEDFPQAKVGGEVSLTHTLVGGLHRGFIPNLNPGSVVPILSAGLQWRAASLDGCEIDCSQLTGLLVTVGSRSVEPAKDRYSFPTYGETVWHANITQGKVGGGTQYYRLVR